MEMNNWMKLLAAHYEQAKRRRPHERFLILFDIDGTILDMRHLIRYVLKRIDRKHGTHHFTGLKVSRIRTHEEDIALFLDEYGLAGEQKEKVLASFETEAWSSTAVMEAHKPFRGVFDVIRWFQAQPGTFVGLNTGRPEAFRFNTLSSLNRLGERYGVSFRDELLFMKPDNWDKAIPAAKVEGIARFRRMGYWPIAMVDNEPENLEAIALHETGRSMILLHAETIFRSRLTLTTHKIVSGSSWDLRHLTGAGALKKTA